MKHSKFKMWHSRAVYEALTGEKLEDKVDKMMKPENLLTEFKEDGKWVPNTCYYVDGSCHPGPGDDCFKCSSAQGKTIVK